MTKKSFIAIAAGFAAQLKDLDANDYVSPDTVDAIRVTIRSCAEMFCVVAASENPRFDRTRFLSACGF